MMYKRNFESLTHRLLATIVVITSVTACSGSDAPTADVAELNNQVLTRGTISDTGNVTVNGRTFSTTNASIILNDKASTQNDLRTGMQVTVQSQDSSATLIHYDEDVKGPVDSNNADGTLYVMGQHVIISPTTVVDDTPVNAGDIVEVSGIRDVNNSIHATFIDVETELPDSFEVRGIVSQLDTSNQTFAIGELSIEYSSAEFDNLSATDLANGDLLEVKDGKLQYEPGSLFLIATKIERYRDVFDISGQPQQSSSPSSSTQSNSNQGSSTQSSSTQSSPTQSNSTQTNAPQRTEIEIEAYVTEILSDDSFMLGSLLVKILPTTKFRDGERDQLQLNSRVEVEGWLNSKDELEAWEVEFDDESAYHDSDDDDNSDSSASDSDGTDDDTEFELEGVVTMIDSVNGTFIIDDKEIHIGTGTEFENSQDQKIGRNEFFAQVTAGKTIVKVNWKHFNNYNEPPHEVEIEV